MSGQRNRTGTRTAGLKARNAAPIKPMSAKQEQRLRSQGRYQHGCTFARRDSPMRQVSKKRAAEIRKRRAMLQAKYPGIVLCEVPYCNRVADDAHEPLTRARGGSITDPANAFAICRPHHREVTDEEPQWAYDLGILVHSWDGAA